METMRKPAFWRALLQSRRTRAIALSLALTVQIGPYVAGSYLGVWHSHTVERLSMSSHVVLVPSR